MLASQKILTVIELPWVVFLIGNWDKRASIPERYVCAMSFKSQGTKGHFCQSFTKQKEYFRLDDCNYTTSNYKGISTDMKVKKVLFMWSRMLIFSFIGYTLMELFRKPDNWRQIYNEASSTFYVLNDMSGRKNY